MDARLLTRCTNLVLVGIVGMTAGHVAMPSRAGAAWGRWLLVATALATAGGIAGWRERREARLARGPGAARAAAWWVLGGAAGALALGAAAWWVVHR